MYIVAIDPAAGRPFPRPPVGGWDCQLYMIIHRTIHSMVGRASWVSAIVWLAGLVRQGR